jgi:hypothetical protein
VSYTVSQSHKTDFNSYVPLEEHHKTVAPNVSPSIPRTIRKLTVHPTYFKLYSFYDVGNTDYFIFDIDDNIHKLVVQFFFRYTVLRLSRYHF